MKLEDLKKKKKIKELKDAKTAAIEAGAMAAEAMTDKNKAAAEEKATGERYKDVNVKPIYSKGVFSSASKYNDSNKITEDDNTEASKKKKKK